MKGGLGGELRVLSSIAEKTEKISNKFHAMSERKSTYDIGTFEGKRGKISSSDIIVEDDDNNLEEAETGSSQQHTKTGGYVREIEVTESSLTKASIDMGPSTSETVEKPHATASTEIPPTSSLQKDKKRDMEQVELMERELKLIYAFLKDVETIEEADARLKYWEEEMIGIAQEAEAIIGKYKNNMRVGEKRFFTRLASKPKNRKADSKVVKKISKIKKKIQGVTERRISYGIVHVEASNSMTHKIHQRRPPSQYSGESDIIGFEDHAYEIPERLLTVDEPSQCHFDCGNGRLW